MVRLVDGPYQQLLVSSFALCSKLLPIRSGKRSKRHREGVAIIPEIFPGSGRADANVTTAAIGQVCLGWVQEFRMPKTKQQTRSKFGLPVRLCRDNLVHKRE